MKCLTKTALAALMGTTGIVTSQAALAQPETTVTDEIVVRGARIPDEKRATSEISSVLDEASFQRTGDADIASALARVSGLSVSEGKFVIVRGLNERYSSVTLNGSPLPSPEPLRRVVPLDLIPTSFLSGSLVQKTFSPQYSGEFGGGLVELRSRSLPDEDYLTIGLSGSLDTVTTARDGLFHDGGGLDWLGFDDGARTAPQLAQQAFFGTTGFNPVADLNALEAQFARPQNVVGFENATPVNYGVNLSLGGSRDFSDDIRFGANFAFTFGNEWQTREGRREQGLTQSALVDLGNPGAGVISDLTIDELTGADAPLGTSANVGDFISTQQITELNGLGTFGLEIGDNHTITSTNLILRSTLKDTRNATSIFGEDDGLQIFQENFEFFERQVWQTQLRGDHVFPGLGDLEVAWRGAYGEAFRDAPFQFQTRRARTGTSGQFFFPFGALRGPVGPIVTDPATVEFSEVQDQNIDAGIDFILPLTVGDLPVDLKFGYGYTDKERDTFVRTFQFDASGDLSTINFAGSRNDVIFSEEVLGSDLFGLDTGAPISNVITLDNATSTLQVHAGYGGVDFPIGDYVRLAAGVRFESGEQVTEAFAPAQPAQTLTRTVIDEDYFLPAATLTWNPIGDLQVRAGFSQTITRPQFRELTPAQFRDDDTDLLILGNPFLINSEVDNFDARVEYYFSRGQFVTIGGFYKDIENPIETQSLLATGGDVFVSFVNAPSAQVYGFEFEFEKNFLLDDLIGGDWLAGKELVVRTNYTYTQSEVSADGDVTIASVNSQAGAFPQTVAAAGVLEDGRSLQGQSDHLVNFQLGIEDPETNSRATFLVNWASERIRQTENLTSGVNAPAVVENPPVLVDFVWSRELERYGGGWQIGIAIRNILGDDYEALQTFEDGSVAAFDTYRLGRIFSANISKSF